MPSVGAIADDYALALQVELVSFEEGRSWVDSLSAEIDSPPHPLIEASISGENKDRLIAALGEFHLLQLPANVEIVQQYVEEFSSYIPEFSKYWESNEDSNYFGDGSYVHGAFSAFVDFVSETLEIKSLNNARFQSKYIEVLHSVIEDLYKVFASYPPGNDFCSFCYSEKDIELITNTPLRKLNNQTVRVLL
jgi:hypothetical protein